VIRVKPYEEWKKRRKETHFTRRWTFAILLGVLLGIASLLDKGQVTTNALSSACRVEVVADTLPARSDPDPTARSLGNLRRGTVTGATTTIRNGYRQLADQSWALDQYLRPLPPVEKCAAQ